MEGWIKIHRKLSMNTLWLCEPFTRGQAWVDLLMLANHEDSFFYVRNIKVDIKRGEVGWSEPKLADRWKWSRTKVRKFLNDLEKEQQIVQHKNFITQIVMIVNYKDYQKKEQQQVQQKDSRKTAERQQQDVNKNDKNEKNEKKISFGDFWNLYDKKRGDTDKIKSKWDSLSFEQQESIMKYIPSYKLSQPTKKFRKDPSTFLNNKSWNDELLFDDRDTPKVASDDYKKIPGFVSPSEYVNQVN